MKITKNTHSAVVALLAIAETLNDSLASFGNAVFVEPKREEGESVLDWANRVVGAKAEFDAQKENEGQFIRETVGEPLNEWFKTHAKPASKRERITDATRERVRNMLKEGNHTNSAIATQCGISVPSVQHIKKEAGLVKIRATEESKA